MISVVLGPDLRAGQPRQEIIVRSLAWLVSAVVAGVVRDVTLAAAGDARLRDIADVTGCRLVEADDAEDRFAQAVRLTRSPRVLMVAPGFAAGDGLVDELDAFDREAPGDACASVLPAPEGWRLRRPHAVGLLASRERCLATPTRDALAKICKRGVRFRSTMRPVT